MGNIYTKNGKPISKGGKLASAQKCCCKKPNACCISQIDDNVEDTTGFTEYAIESNLVLGSCVNVACDDCSKGFTIQGYQHTVYHGACKNQCQTPCITDPPPVCCCGDGGCFPITTDPADTQKCEAAGGTVHGIGSCPQSCETPTSFSNEGACCEDKGDGTTSCYITTQCECEVGATYAVQNARTFLGVGTTCDACCASPKHLCGEGEFAKCCEETETCCGEGENVVCCPQGWHCCNGVCQEERCSCSSDQDCKCDSNKPGCAKCIDGTCQNGSAFLAAEFDRSFGMDFPGLCCQEFNTNPAACAQNGTPTGRCDCGSPATAMSVTCDQNRPGRPVIFHECGCDECPVIVGWPLDKYPVIPTDDYEFACWPRNQDGSCPGIIQFNPCAPP